MDVIELFVIKVIEVIKEITGGVKNKKATHHAFAQGFAS
jgi:hypothetical protein